MDASRQKCKTEEVAKYIFTDNVQALPNLIFLMPKQMPRSYKKNEF